MRQEILREPGAFLRLASSTPCLPSVGGFFRGIMEKNVSGGRSAMKAYDPSQTARDVFDVLRNHNTPLALVDKVFEHTRELIERETCLTNAPASSGQPLSQQP